MQRFPQVLAAAAVMAVWHLAAPAANAQATAPQTAPQSTAPERGDPAAPAANIPDEKIDAAAAAVQRVTSLKRDYQERLAAAPTAEQQRIVDEANGALAKAVTDQGLSVEEYSRILEVAQNDTTVRDRILQRVRPAPN